jgi:hypothetical protein
MHPLSPPKNRGENIIGNDFFFNLENIITFMGYSKKQNSVFKIEF